MLNGRAGANLLYLLAEHAGKEAKIASPEDWGDPIPEWRGPILLRGSGQWKIAL